MSIVQLKRITVGYDDYGNGMPCLFIHGHPFNRSMWADQRQALVGPYRLITPDLRGYGETTVIPGKTFLEDFAQDLAEFLDALKVEQVVLGGLSMGGQIVFEFYRLFPERVRALILADTFAQLDTETRKRERYETADRLSREGMAAYADEVLPKMVSRTTLVEANPVAARVLDMMRASPPEGAAAALRGRAERQDYTPLLPHIAVPTLVVVGRDDEFTPVSDAEFMQQNIRGAQLVIVERAGHMPNMECSDEFNRAVLEFLAQTGKADGG